ncbi:MAG TPA: VTT domain-containing protein [Gemmatimonadales bacterium]|nr:VTT domain-containing protein [Gemmatimonadales bacterium]
MYIVLGLLAAVENLVPPVPADTAVALGAFLSQRGVISLPAVYAVTLGSNIAGAAAVYFAARRYGRRLFSTSAGRRLLTPASLAAVEREYLRFGLIGIFLGRFLPGIRGVVAPFAGLANLSPARALIPMTLASAIWYGVITLLGAAIGARWQDIAGLVGGINRTLAIVGAVVVAIVVVIWVRRRRLEGRDPMWGLLRRAVGPDTDPRTGEEAMRDAALLMLELAYADTALSDPERGEVALHLRQRWGLEPAQREPAEPGPPSRLAGYRERFQGQFAHERRLALLERLWQLAFEPGAGRRTRDLLARRATEALGFSADELERVPGLRPEDPGRPR